MTPLSQFLAFFPALITAIAIGFWVWFIVAPSLINGLGFVGVVYGLPLLCYHIHAYFYPISEGISSLTDNIYSPWWGSHQIQVFYSTFPFFEKLLLLVPGLFSVWLRLWGSSIGKQVYWTPSVHIIDRGLLKVGDRVIFGHQTSTSSHAIKPKGNRMRLFVQTIEIGNDVFISAGVAIGPGVKIPDHTYIPFGKIIYPGETFEN
jgi:acetyltransferase-like isoleucine patch superfamily enzyme